MKANVNRFAVSKYDWDRVSRARCEYNFLRSLENEEVAKENPDNYLFNAALAETIEERMNWLDCYRYVKEIREA